MKERYLLEDGSDNSFSLITDYDGNDEQAFDVNVKSGEILPVLPLRNMVLFPGVFLPITVGRKSSLKLIRDADKKHKDIAVVCQRSAHTEDPKLEDLHNIGTVGRIVRILEMPDQTTTVILQGMKRLNLTSIIETHPYLKGEIELLEEDIPSKDDKEFQALVETCKDLTMRYIKSSDVMHQDSSFAIKNINSPMFLVNFICSNLPFKKDEKMDLLSIHSLRERTYHLLEILNREVQLAEIKASIQMRAREDIDQQQREYFLQQQIKTIQDELGGGGQEQEIEEMRQKAERMRWNAEVRETFMKELAKLERTHPQSPDYSVQLNYLQTMLNLPWGTYTTDNLNLKNAEKTLNKDHYGLEKVKEGGVRCFKCYELRLRETAEIAKEGGYDYFTTTLSISPLKNAAKLNEIGLKLAEEYGVSYLTSDFKKKNGYKRSVELSAQYGLYRQDYCGCVFSMREREEQKARIEQEILQNNGI